MYILKIKKNITGNFNITNKQGYIAEELKPNNENENKLNFNYSEENLQNNEIIDIDWDIFNNVQISKINDKNIICLSDDGPLRRSCIDIKKSHSSEENNFNCETKSNSPKIRENIQLGENNTGVFELSSNLTLGKNQTNKFEYSNNIENNELKNINIIEK